MKTKLNLCLLLGALAVLPACVTERVRDVAQPVGPAPSQEAQAPADGGLVVYSAFKQFGFGQSDVHLHSRYTLYAADGKVLQSVQNYRDRYDENPVRLSLAPGRYRIRARSAHSGWVSVPVDIQRGRTTCVYLDGTNPAQAQAGAADIVRLPDGQAVGWAVNSTAKPAP